MATRTQRLGSWKVGATLLTSESSYLQDGMGWAGVAPVTLIEVTWAQSLPQGISAHKAKLIALTQAPRWGNSQTINICTDS